MSFRLICGVMASSAVSSVLYLRDAVGNHAETKVRRCCYFPCIKFRTRLRVAGKTCDQYIEAMSKVVDGLRGGASVACTKF